MILLNQDWGMYDSLLLYRLEIMIFLFINWMNSLVLCKEISFLGFHEFYDFFPALEGACRFDYWDILLHLSGE